MQRKKQIYNGICAKSRKAKTNKQGNGNTKEELERDRGRRNKENRQRETADKKKYREIQDKKIQKKTW
jgi:hypothetical protein